MPNRIRLKNEQLVRLKQGNREIAAAVVGQLSHRLFVINAPG